jgi:hypothetical protein
MLGNNVATNLILAMNKKIPLKVCSHIGVKSFIMWKSFKIVHIRCPLTDKYFMWHAYVVH